jgi:uncharacterized protein YbcV (DUF1398 family)
VLYPFLHYLCPLTLGLPTSFDRDWHTSHWLTSQLGVNNLSFVTHIHPWDELLKVKGVKNKIDPKKSKEQMVNDSIFPKMLNELAEEGTTSYKMDLSQRRLVYYGTGGSEKARSFPGKKLAIGSKFNQELLKDVWMENDYETFLSEIARAGVKSYIVDTSARTITYFGSGNKYTEVVPLPNRADSKNPN